MYDLGLLLFRDEVVHHTTVREHLRRTLLEMVLMERKGEMADRYNITYASVHLSYTKTEMFAFIVHCHPCSVVASIVFRPIILVV